MRTIVLTSGFLAICTFLIFLEPAYGESLDDGRRLHLDYPRMIDNAVDAYTIGHITRACAGVEDAKNRNANIVDLSVDERVRTLNNSSLLNAKCGNTVLALAEINEAVELLHENQSQLPAVSPVVQSNRAIILGELKNWSEAETAFTEVYESRKAVLGVNAPETIGSLTNLAVARWHLNDLESAEEMLDKAAGLNKAFQNEYTTLSVNILLNQSSLYSATLRPSEALAAANSAWELSKRGLGDADPLTIRSQINLAHKLQIGRVNWDDLEKSRQMFRGAYAAAIENQDPSDDEYLTIRIYDFLALEKRATGFLEAPNMISGGDLKFYLGEMGSRIFDLATIEEKIRFSRDRLNIAERIDDDNLAESELRSLASTYLKAGELRKAEGFAERSLETHLTRSDFMYVAQDSLEIYLTILRKLGHDSKIGALVNRRQRANGVFEQIDLLQGRYYEDRRGPADNLELADQQLALLSQYPGNRSYRYATVLDHKAVFLSEAGRPIEALEVIEQSIEITRAALGENNADVLRLLGFYSRLLAEAGRVTEARKVINEAIRRGFVIDSIRNENFSTLIELLSRTALLEAADEWADRQLQIRAREIEFQKSREIRNLELVEQGQIGDLMITLAFEPDRYFDKVRVLLLMGRFAEAETISKDIIEQLSADYQHDISLANLLYGSALLGQSKYKQAEAAFLIARNSLDKLASFDPLAYDEISLLLIRTYLFQPNRRGRALKLIAPIVERAESNRIARLNSVSSSSDAALSRSSIADLFALFSNVLWSRNRTKAANSERSMIGNHDQNQAFISLQTAMETSASRAIAQFAGRQAARKRGKSLEKLAIERTKTINEWASADLRYSQVIGDRSDRSDAERREIIALKQQLEARFQAIDERLRAEAPDYFALIRPEPLSLPEAQDMLAADEAALLLVPSEFGTHVMAVTKDGEGLKWHRSELKAEDIEKAVADLRKGLDQQVNPLSRDYDKAFDRTAAYELYKALIEPVADKLKGKTHVYVAAAGSLTSLPLSVLVTAPPEGEDDDPEALRNTPWLSDKYALVQIPSLQSLQLLRSLQSKKAANDNEAMRPFDGFGDPVLAPVKKAAAGGAGTGFDDLFVRGTRSAEGAGVVNLASLKALPSLPGTGTELENLRTSLGAPESSIRLQTAATEEAVKDADLSNSRILAFATHGVLAGEISGAAEPGLVFTPPETASDKDDGLLTASEITTLNLNADWVILSACNTASGDGKGAPGLSGLARSFFYAGARNLLASHWPVRDDVASTITVDTIDQQKTASLSRAQAFQKAMQNIRNDSTDTTKAHPAAWAPFVLVGDK